MKSAPRIITHFWNDKINRHATIIGLVYLLLIFLTKNIFDYSEYQKQWQFYLDGGNPWDFGSNAYGPLHNLLAYLYQIHPKLPRMIFAASALITSIFLARKIDQSSLSKSWQNRSFFLLLYSPLMLIMITINGCNDGLVSMLLLFGLFYYDKKHFVISSILICSAIFYKFYPLFLLPVLFINGRKVNWKFSLSTLFILAAGAGTSYLLWGEKFLHPLLYNSHRESKILSIFRYLRGEFSFLKPFGIENLDHYSNYLVIAGVVITFFLHLFYNWHWMKSLVITFIAVNLFYLVGHFQFYLSLYFMIFYFIIRLDKDQIDFGFKKMSLFLYWISGATLLFGITEGFYHHFHIIREFIGVPNFIILLITALSVVKLKIAD